MTQFGNQTSRLTIHDVARRANVSIATVSRVLNHPERVGEKMRLQVEAAVRELNFVPDAIASSLVTRRSKCAGLFIPNLGPFYVPLIREIERVFNAEGAHLIVTTGELRGNDVAKAVQFLKQRRCDAIIVNPGETPEQTIVDMLATEPNLLLVFRRVRNFESRCVLVDNREGARMATRYLIDCGHRHVAVITGAATHYESNERYAGFIDAMQEAGLTADPALHVRGDFEVADGRRETAELLSRRKPFTALFCFSDEIAAGAMSYLHSVGKVLPRDVSVVGFDDFVYAERLHPRLTTVRQPVADIARVVARRALAFTHGESGAPGPSLLSPSLIVRDSVTPLPATPASSYRTNTDADVDGDKASSYRALVR